MRKAVICVWAGSAVLLGWTVVGGSELILNVLSAWLSSAGLAFSVWNLRVRRRTGRLRLDLRQLYANGLPGDYKVQDLHLAERAEDGIVEGLLMAAVGSIVAAVGQAIFLALK